MSKINWNDGKLITLKQGDTATCEGGLNAGQLYCLFFYNAAGNDASTNVSVVWSNSQPPVQVNVPGTTGNQGLAALCFVDGSQTNTVSAAVTQGNQGAEVEAFICSVKMPTNTAGINNTGLPLNGEPQAFNKFTRFYAVPASHWYSARIQSDVNQFITVQFKEEKATVFVVNELVDPSVNINYAGDTAKMVDVKSSKNQSIDFSLQGNGRQWVWMNADSIQNSKDASITVQSLSGLFATL